MFKISRLIVPSLVATPALVHAQNVGIDIPAPLKKLQVYNGASGVTRFAFSPLMVEGNGHKYINLLGPAANGTAVLFGQFANSVHAGQAIWKYRPW